MRVSIIGDGAMGLLFASYLSLSADVAVFSRRNERSELRNRNGITVLVKDGSRVFHPVFTTDKSMMAGSELVVLFVKSASTVPVIDEYKEFIPDDAYIMTLQNGAGHFEELNAFFPEDRIIIGVTEHNASLSDECTLRHGGTGPTEIGMMGGTVPCWIPEMFNASSIDTSVSSSVMESVWRKLLTNSSLSTATALLMCSIDEIGRSGAAFSLVGRLLKEAVETAASDGYSFSYDDVLSMLRDKARKTFNAYTSIYADILNGRKTEVDYISGYVVKRAQANGIDVPYQRAAVDIIHAKEEIGINC